MFCVNSFKIFPYISSGRIGSLGRCIEHRRCAISRRIFQRSARRVYRFKVDFFSFVLRSQPFLGVILFVSMNSQSQGLKRIQFYLKPARLPAQFVTGETPLPRIYNNAVRISSETKGSRVTASSVNVAFVFKLVGLLSSQLVAEIGSVPPRDVGSVGARTKATPHGEITN